MRRRKEESKNFPFWSNVHQYPPEEQALEVKVYGAQPYLKYFTKFWSPSGNYIAGVLFRSCTNNVGQNSKWTYKILKRILFKNNVITTQLDSQQQTILKCKTTLQETNISLVLRNLSITLQWSFHWPLLYIIILMCFYVCRLLQYTLFTYFFWSGLQTETEWKGWKTDQSGDAGEGERFGISPASN